MAPPPRPSVGFHQQTPRTGTFDESLRLPPLQTRAATSGDEGTVVDVGPAGSAPTPASASASASVSRPRGVSFSLRESQARSIEAMVMSIPFLNKIQVLRKISPALAPPGPASPAVETRGPVIAIEGTDPELMTRVAHVLQTALAGSDDCAVRVWASADETLRSGSVGTVVGTIGGSPFSRYLQTIQDWHVKSGEMVRFVTTHPLPPPAVPEDAVAGGEDAVSGAGTGTGTGTVSVSVLPGFGGRVPPRLPVALVTGGFSLTLSDHFASTVPIADAYAPVDHWQWMATLWRGIVGPDLVICVRAHNDHAAEQRQQQCVELPTPGVMVVNAPEGAALLEKTERRLAFEVVEWVRGGSFADGFGRR